MDFLAQSLLYGIVFAGPVDRTLLPIANTTEFVKTGNMAKTRYDLVSPNRIRMRSTSTNGGSNADSSYFDLNADGTFAAQCLDSGGDFRRNGHELRYDAAGNVTKEISWYKGKAQDTLNYTVLDGHVVGNDRKTLFVTWTYGRIDRIETGSSIFRTVESFRYSADGDTIQKRIEEVADDPVIHTFVFKNGRLQGITLSDTAGVVASRTSIRYNAPPEVAIRVPTGRSRLSYSVIPAFDALGRAAIGHSRVPMLSR